MTALNKQALREAAEKATQGEWWSGVVETDGEYGNCRVSGYHSYAVYVGDESLLDMTNSTAACIHEEWDDEYHMAWDETGKRNANFIAAANPATVLELLDELEHYKSREERVTRLVLDNSISWDELYKKLESAEKRIAEQNKTLMAARSYVKSHAAGDGHAFGVLQAIDRSAGIGVKGE